ncbi:MAG TPA: aldo/keto reductase [Gemmatimonadaceae bacterium]|nr:aldo/keto reductase [Gemmatimonadaceae bacterium]
MPNAPDRSPLSRREALKIGVGAGLALTLDRLPAFAAPASPAAAAAAARSSQALPLIERAIPSSGERVPIVGIGTARNYENPAPEALPPLREVLQRFPELGGRVIDTAPGYGRAEIVVGDLLAELKNRDKYFIATKVSVGGRGGGGGTREDAIAQMEESLRRLHTDRIDLMQIWNLSSPDLLLPLLDEWKAAKKIRYTGITTSNDRQYAQLETLMQAHKFDFIQVDLAIDNRGAQDRLLPLAAERGMGVLINLPFGRTRVFQKVLGKPLPDWAKEIDCTSWAQLFLKYIVGHPAVTCVIPGTEKVEFVVDNLGAARGRLPDVAMRKQIETYFDAL